MCLAAVGLIGKMCKAEVETVVAVVGGPGNHTVAVAGFAVGVEMSRVVEPELGNAEAVATWRQAIGGIGIGVVVGIAESATLDPQPTEPTAVAGVVGLGVTGLAASHRTHPTTLPNALGPRQE